jgi:hypothetical protein
MHREQDQLLIRVSLNIHNICSISQAEVGCRYYDLNDRVRFYRYNTPLEPSTAQEAEGHKETHHNKRRETFRLERRETENYQRSSELGIGVFSHMW